MPHGSVGLTLDTGALIALDRRDRRMLAYWQRSSENRERVTVPTIVIVEWWRGQRERAAELIRGATIEPLSERLAMIAGKALAELSWGPPSLADAIVMASAAQRGDVVLTSDFDDLDRLRQVFPSVRVRRV